MIQGGSIANKQGKVLENFVRTVLLPHGFNNMSYAKWKDSGEPVNTLVEGVPYTTIYGTVGRTEFLLVLKNKYIRIECKWQQSSGSVDEKYPYLFENMKRVPEQFVVVLLDGGGYKPSARSWLKSQCLNCTTKDIKLFDMAEFMAWSNKNL